MGDSRVKFCEITDEVIERAIVCPFLIQGLGDPDYCGYYGKDIGTERRRLQNCEIEAVIKATEEKRLSRRVEKKPFLGEEKK